MPQLRRRTGFAQKAKPRRFITEISLADDFQCHGAVQIDVERLVSDAHRTPTQFDRFPVFARHQLIMLKSLRCQFRVGLTASSERRLAGFNPTSQSLAKNADRTEFYCCRKLIAATRADALRLRFHGPNGPSAESEPKTTPRSTPVVRKRPGGPWQIVVPFHKLVCSIICAASSNRNKKHQTSPGHPTARHTQPHQDPEYFGPPQGTPDKSAALILPIPVIGDGSKKAVILGISLLASTKR